MKSVEIRSYFWSVFTPNAGKYGPEITLYLNTFHAVLIIFTGSWGGIWSAPNRYSLSSTSKYQTDVNLVTQFNDTKNIRTWSPGSNGVDNRVPYIVDHKLTTSAKGTNEKPLGTITGIIWFDPFFPRFHLTKKLGQVARRIKDPMKNV